MDKLERAQRLHKTLNLRHTPFAMTDMQAMFDDCSESTVKRTLQDLRNLGAPIYCTDGLGYSYDKHIAFELPGVWFSPEELHALLTIEQLTANLSGGLFDESIKLIQQKATSLLGKHMPAPSEIRRIRMLATGSRSKILPMFAVLTSAVLQRQRLHLLYHGRQRGEQSERTVSPQRLVFYKGNWFLDCWCHKAKALRSFAVEKIEQAGLLDESCKEIPDEQLNEKLMTSFGIFSGKATATAVLHFTEKAARWVADEEWFPGECGCWLENGDFELRIPYHNPTELIMEICRYGADVEVIEPTELRQQVAQKLQAAADQYKQ
ncbi:MAG: WYL domain-containing transcriptional regulator [Mariprofundus sp.]|nr:WYL domain-containing transcriptional regulator [Mariprofundus sp.]